MELTRRTVLGSVGGAVVTTVTGATIYGEVVGGNGSDPTVLVAGSLLDVAESVPGATVEAHGSVAVRRLVVEGNRDPDAVALADPALFAGISPTATLFATNSLVLAYDPTASVSAALQRDWQSAIQQSTVSLGRTDPDLDPLGYRTVMALRLAGDRTDLTPERVLANTTVVPETELLNVVEGGELDAAFVYRNMAVQRDLPYVTLPTWLNFSDPAAASRYGAVSYDLGDRTVRGKPIRYGVSALTEAGTAWVDRLVTGEARLERRGFTVPDQYPAHDRSIAALRSG